jgi:hypothetical protein
MNGKNFITVFFAVLRVERPSINGENDNPYLSLTVAIAGILPIENFYQSVGRMGSAIS